MRYAGIDIASATHVIAIVTAEGEIEAKAMPFGEDAAGYEKALALLGSPGEVLIVVPPRLRSPRVLRAPVGERLRSLRTHRPLHRRQPA